MMCKTCLELIMQRMNGPQGTRHSAPIVLVLGWTALDARLLGATYAFSLHERLEGWLQWIHVLFHAQFTVTTGWLIIGEHGRKTTAGVLLATVLAILAFNLVA